MGRLCIGFDTSNYTTSAAVFDGETGHNCGRLLTVPWTICDRAELAEKVAAMDTDVVVSFGAGNIDACCGALAEKLREKA